MKHDSHDVRRSEWVMKIAALTAFAAATGSPSPAAADPVDNPGNAQLYDATGLNAFFTFSTSEKLTIPSGTIEFYVEPDGSSYYASSTLPLASTSQAVGLSSAISAQVVIDSSTVKLGKIDLSGASPAMDWEIVARVLFSAPGANVNPVLCKTPAFTVKISGDYQNGVNSSTFTIPSLTGTGTGACNGHSAEINGDFGLGSSGSYWTFNKWYAQNLDSSPPAPLTGS